MAGRRDAGIKETGWPGGAARGYGWDAVRRRQRVQLADGLRCRHGVQSADGLRHRCGVQPLGGPSGVPRRVHHGGDEGEKLDNMNGHVANACYCVQGGNKELGKARVY